MPGSALAERAPLQPTGDNPEAVAGQPDILQTQMEGVPVVETGAMQPGMFEEQQSGGQDYDVSPTGGANQNGEQVDPVDARVLFLRNAVDELAGDSATLSDETRDYVRAGGGIETALTEIDELRGKKSAGPESDMQAARQEYIRALASKDKGARETAQQHYKEAVVAAFREASQRENETPAGESEGKPTAERLAEERLSIVTDLVLTERHKMREGLQDAGPKPNVASRLLGNKKVRMSMVSGLIGTALATRFGMLPTEASTHMVENSLNVVTAFMFARNSQGAIAERLKERSLSRQAAKQAAQIEADEASANITKRVVSRSRNRSGNHEGDVYAPSETKRYVGDVVLNHGEEIQTVADKPEEADEAYAQLLESLVEEELSHARKRVSVSKAKVAVFTGLSIAASMSMTGPLATVAESTVLGKEAAETMRL